jgi:4-amino-4-deoxy-L-arabinose transferase-like glycosyltransferase
VNPRADIGGRIRSTSAVLCAILLIAFVFRSARLLSLFPILIDESIYLRWAEIIQHQHVWFISLLDAKQPLSLWLLAGLRLVYRGDPLLAGRLLSVAAGVGSCIFLYRVGTTLDGVKAGLMAAALYAVFPYAVFYDRIAYTEALINLFCVALIWRSTRILQQDPPRKAEYVICGLVLGFGLLCKTTILQLSFAPALAVALSARKAYKPLVITYAIASVFPLASMLLVPEGPTFGSNQMILHQQQFFTPVWQLLRDPFFNFRENFSLLLSYYYSYVGLLLLAAAVASSFYLAKRKRRTFLFVGSLFLFPAILQLFVLEYFPSRLLLCAIAAADLTASQRRYGMIVWLAVSILLLASAERSLAIIRNPQKNLQKDDAEEFLGAHPYAGFGSREAVEYLRSQVGSGFLVLTDPYWGPPADAMFIYLNGSRGIEIHEAWWLEISESYPLLPPGKVPLMKSHYQRIFDKEIDLNLASRVYYVTDSDYSPSRQVHERNGNALLVASFKKPNSEESIDVYRLR